jgi:polar amino acid transport system substrate-binding protein
MRRRTVIFFVLIGLIAMITCQGYANNTIKIGYWITEPEVIAKSDAAMDKHPAGAAVDYWEKYIAPGMGVDIEWIGPLSLARIQTWLEDGTIDATVWLAKNPDRAARFLYPNGSFAETQAALAIHKNNPLNKIEKVADISNLKIGYVTEAFMTSFMKDPSIKFDLVSSPDHLSINIPKLESGRIDAVYSPDIMALKYGFIKFSNVKNFKFLLLPDQSIGVYSVFSKKANPEFFKKYEAVNEASKAKYAKLLKKYVHN